MKRQSGNKKRVIVAGGGTGGHIYPALAVIEELKCRYGNDIKCIYVGTAKGMESRLADQNQIPFVPVSAAGLVGKPGIKALQGLMKNLKGVVEAIGLIRRFKPDAVLGTGGFVCAPICIAAALCKVPYVIHEQNSYPGSANRLLSRKAAYVAISIEGTQSLFPDPEKCILTGNPVRIEILQADKKTARERLNISEKDKVVLIVGGSLGARALNNAVVGAMPLIMQKTDLKIIMITGKKEFGAVKAQMDEMKKSGDDPYLSLSLVSYADNIQDYLASADLAVSRAGATTIAELSASSTPAVFIPYPYAASDHQKKNALIMCNEGAASMIDETDLTPEVLAAELCRLLDDSELLGAMSRSISTCYIANSAKKIADLLEKAAAGKGSV